jgi:hypothetical protein
MSVQVRVDEDGHHPRRSHHNEQEDDVGIKKRSAAYLLGQSGAEFVVNSSISGATTASATNPPIKTGSKSGGTAIVIEAVTTVFLHSSEIHPTTTKNPTDMTTNRDG